MGTNRRQEKKDFRGGYGLSHALAKHSEGGEIIVETLSKGEKTYQGRKKTKMELSQNILDGILLLEGTL